MISLDSVRMHVVSTAACGQVNRDTVFEFTQQDAVVSARYAGGGIVLGYLIGTIDRTTLHFRFVQINNAGLLDGGHSTCDVSRLPDGRLQLIEHFTWASGAGTGSNIFQEIACEA